MDEKARSVALTEEGIARVERSLSVTNLYDPSQMETLHHVNQALKAHTLFKRDVDYIIKDGQVIIVDEFTGRLMPGRRYSDGLHQALEAKESVKIENENQTLATITFQNYFRMYEKLAGMTGTADTEAAEFKKIYNLDVVVIPTNLPMVRCDNPDLIYKTESEKFEAVINEIRELSKKGQPVLVGTISIEKSEELAHRLKKLGIHHSVLNAKNHALEAEIVAQAGRYKAVTISTNMAGRGTDIILGGNPKFLANARVNKHEKPEEYSKALSEFIAMCDEERNKVLEAGGLHILGTERHEARRIDNQLRGRSGRQGDPGSSRFYLSLEDDLMRIFGGDRVKMIMERVGMEEGEPIEHKYTTKAIENAQKKVEGHNFEIRKHLIEFDDVMNKQREVVYSQRRFILGGSNLKENVLEMTEDIVEEMVDRFIDEKTHFEDWDIKAMEENLWGQFGLKFDLAELPAGEQNRTGVEDHILDAVKAQYDNRELEITPEVMRELEKFIMLQSVDNQWKDHLLSMDHLKDGIGLRGYGQRDPLKEYQKEGYELFLQMSHRIKAESVRNLFLVKIATHNELDELTTARGEEMNTLNEKLTKRSATPTTKKRSEEKIGRNAPCPCGSGKKYKKCCGK